MSANHTPGPWFRTNMVAANRFLKIEDKRDGGGAEVARVRIHNRVTDGPNARLIAAAPALANALDVLLDRMTDSPAIEPDEMTKWAQEIRGVLRAAGRLP